MPDAHNNNPLKTNIIQYFTKKSKQIKKAQTRSWWKKKEKTICSCTIFGSTTILIKNGLDKLDNLVQTNNQKHKKQNHAFTGFGQCSLVAEKELLTLLIDPHPSLYSFSSLCIGQHSKASWPHQDQTLGQAPQLHNRHHQEECH